VQFTGYLRKCNEYRLKVLYTLITKINIFTFVWNVKMTSKFSEETANSVSRWVVINQGISLLQDGCNCDQTVRCHARENRSFIIHHSENISYFRTNYKLKIWIEWRLISVLGRHKQSSLRGAERNLSGEGRTKHTLD
jgi:hypothetical protein